MKTSEVNTLKFCCVFHWPSFFDATKHKKTSHFLDWVVVVRIGEIKCGSERHVAEGGDDFDNWHRDQGSVNRRTRCFGVGFGEKWGGWDKCCVGTPFKLGGSWFWLCCLVYHLIVSPLIFFLFPLLSLSLCLCVVAMNSEMS